MSGFIKPDAYHILAGEQVPDNQANRQAENQAQSTRKPSRREKFQAKAKRVWNAVMDVARGIRENIVPIITGLGAFLTGCATFRNRVQRGGYYRCPV